MIQDILPHKYDNSFKQPALAKDSFLLYIHRGTILLRGRDEQGEENQEQGKKQDYREKIYASAHTLPAPDALELPAAAQLEETGLIPGLSARAEYLFSIDEIPYFMVRSAEGDPALKLAEEENQETFQEDGSGKFSFQGPAYFRIMQPEYQAFAAITAVQLFRWKESRKFCGCCGSRTEDSRTERALVCTKCGHTEYPKICPAVIVAVMDGDRLLMSRYKGRAYRGYALIAGFVEIGETFEETVRREVMEEVGLKVKNIRYYKSQPWAFTDTEMIGFFAELDGDDAIRLQEDELSEAGWYHRDEIPEDVSSISVGSEMKMAFKHQRI
jgi:NAD+ diphosphatase